MKTLRTATVTVEIVPAPLEQTVRNRPVHLRNLGAESDRDGVTRRTSTSRFAETGRRSRAIQPDDATAFVDLAGLGAGDYTLTVHADSSRDAGVDANRTRSNPGADHQCQELKADRKPALRRIPRLFGTDGIRGRAGAHPLDPPTVRRIGAALVRALPRGRADRPRRGC